MSLLRAGVIKQHKPTKTIFLCSGRTHQLRVHLCSIQHRIVGDFTYSFRQDFKSHRMMLHAYRLVIPMEHETIDVTAPDPFTQQHDKLWVPGQVFQTYEKYVEENGLRTEKQPQRPHSPLPRALHRYHSSV